MNRYRLYVSRFRDEKCDLIKNKDSSPRIFTAKEICDYLDSNPGYVAGCIRGYKLVKGCVVKQHTDNSIVSDTIVYTAQKPQNYVALYNIKGELVHPKSANVGVSVNSVAKLINCQSQKITRALKRKDRFCMDNYIVIRVRAGHLPRLLSDK